MWWPRPDPDDLRQERSLALLEGRDPDEAAKAWVRRERDWYRQIAYSYDMTDDEPQGDTTIFQFVEKRSVEGISKRREYTRNWWRVNGKAYRLRRSQPGKARQPSFIDTPADTIHDQTNETSTAGMAAVHLAAHHHGGTSMTDDLATEDLDHTDDPDEEEPETSSGAPDDPVEE